VTLAYAKKLSDIVGEESAFSDLHIGVNAGFTSEDIASIDQGSGFGINVAAFYYPKYEDYSIGLMVKNAGFTNNRPNLPLAIRLGMGYRLSLENMSRLFSDEALFTFPENDTSADIDVVYYPEEQIARVNAGAEKYWALNKYHSVALRAGYKFGHDLGAIAGLTLGAGYRMTAGKDTSFEIDYSLNPYGDLDITHRVALTAKFMGSAESHYKKDTKAAAGYYKEGYELLYDNKYSAAVEKFGLSIKRDRSYINSYLGMGACFLRMGKKDTALKVYKKGLEIDPSNKKLKDYIKKLSKTTYN